MLAEIPKRNVDELTKLGLVLSSLYSARCIDPNETWLPLLQKAYAKAYDDICKLDRVESLVPSV